MLFAWILGFGVGERGFMESARYIYKREYVCMSSSPRGVAATCFFFGLALIKSSWVEFLSVGESGHRYPD